MRFAYWITKATDIHSEYVILIAFLQQRSFRESASKLRYLQFRSCYVVGLSYNTALYTAQLIAAMSYVLHNL